LGTLELTGLAAAAIPVAVLVNWFFVTWATGAMDRSLKRADETARRWDEIEEQMRLDELNKKVTIEADDDNEWVREAREAKYQRRVKRRLEESRERQRRRESKMADPEDRSSD
jgi:hypothetical protein